MARRAKGEGSLFHRVPKKCEDCDKFASCLIRLKPKSYCQLRDCTDAWLYQTSFTGPDGKRRRKTISAPTKTELRKKIKLMKTTNDNVLIPEMTFGEWCGVWQGTYLTDTRIRPSTKTHYKSLLKYIPNNLKTKRMSALKPIMFEKVIHELLTKGGKKKQGLSSKTVRSFRTLLINCLDRAVENDLIKRNPLKTVNPPELKQKEIVYLETTKQIRDFLVVVDSGTYYDDVENAMQDVGSLYLIKEFSVLIRLALSTGMRIGELLGLSFEDIDFDDSTINVRHGLVKGKITEPKTKYSKRIIDIDADTMRRLREWKSFQEDYAKKLGDLFKNRLKTVFTNTTGNYVNADNFRKRYFNKMCQAAELPEGFTFHSLRHTHASMLFAKSVNLKIISERLGHSSVSFTAKVYVHIIKKLKRKASKACADVFAKINKV